MTLLLRALQVEHPSDNPFPRNVGPCNHIALLLINACIRSKGLRQVNDLQAHPEDVDQIIIDPHSRQAHQDVWEVGGLPGIRTTKGRAVPTDLALNTRMELQDTGSPGFISTTKCWQT